MCKDQSSNISDIKPVDNGSEETLSVQVMATAETMEMINEATKDDDTVTVQARQAPGYNKKQHRHFVNVDP